MKLLLSLFPLLFFISCISKSGTEEEPKQTAASVKGAGDSTEDAKAKTYLEGLLMPIKDNFKRINAIPDKEWSSVISKELNESGEGGVATFYFYNTSLEKIVSRYYGETGQQLTEYYLMKDKLSFVLEKDIKYNRPVGYDAAHAKENDDTVVFDTAMSAITETRYYFQYGTLVYIAGGKNGNEPLVKNYLEEKQRRILHDFNALVKMSKH